MGIDYRELSRMVRSTDGVRKTTEFVAEALEAKELKPKEFSLRRLFEHTMLDGSGEPCGHELISECLDPQGPRNSLVVMESAGAVNSAAFAQITGQLLINEVMRGYMDEEFIFSRIIPSIPTSLNGEKIPGITRLGDKEEEVDEGQPYPSVGLSQDWIRTPTSKKRGFKVPVTREAIFFDRTGLVLQHANEAGQSAGLKKEKRLIQCVVDEGTTAFRYNWRDVVIATYGDNSGTHTWDNLAASNALVDWTDIEAAELLLAAMTDPFTAEPILMQSRHLVCCPELKWTARRIVNATEIRFGDGASATTQTVSANPVAGLEVVSSRLMPAIMATDTSWFLGDLAKAFSYQEIWPITTSQAPTGHSDEFDRDIVVQYKVSHWGTPATREPRAVVKSTVA